MAASCSASAKFIQLYESLPSDAQHALVENSLAPLLNLIPKERSNRTLASAARLNKTYANMPSLNLKVKKLEIATLLDELARDNKRSYVREKSRKEELLAELIDSVIDWLNEIWKVIYEYRTNFSKAHACLLYASQVVQEIGNARVGCKCSFMNMYISAKIRRSSGKVVKAFHFTGTHNLEHIMLWIWRDLFVVMLAHGTKRQRATIPDMLDDIHVEYGWKALERLLYGGRKCELHTLHYIYDIFTPLAAVEDDDDDADKLDEDFDFDFNDSIIWLENNEDNDEDYTDTEGSDGTACSDAQCLCGFHASHWSNKLNDARVRLRKLVRTFLISQFSTIPSHDLFTSIVGVSDVDHMNGDDVCEELLPTLMRIATHSSENYAAALHICAMHNHRDELMSLLTNHSHLLRPRDIAAYQLAIIIIAASPTYQLDALRILERELLDIARAIHAAVRSAFCHIDTLANKTELTEIMGLRQEVLGRRGRIERWVGAVVTPSNDTAHPMALAALMMGLPLPPGMEDAMDDADPLGYIDVDINDPELDDLREEFRPNLKGHLEGWIAVGRTIKGGTAVLLKVYTAIVEMMPFMGLSDMVDEMTGRLSDKPSKKFLCDALDALWGFCRQQKRKFAKPKTKQKPSSTSACSPSTSSIPGQSSNSGKVMTTFVTINTPQPKDPGGGMDDVD